MSDSETRVQYQIFITSEHTSHFHSKLGINARKNKTTTFATPSRCGQKLSKSPVWLFIDSFVLEMSSGPRTRTPCVRACGRSFGAHTHTQTQTYTHSAGARAHTHAHIQTGRSNLAVFLAPAAAELAGLGVPTLHFPAQDQDRHRRRRQQVASEFFVPSKTTKEFPTIIYRFPSFRRNVYEYR